MLYFIGNTILLMFFLLSLAAASTAGTISEKKQKSFKLSELEENLEEVLADSLDRDDLQVKNVKVKREDSNKTFTLNDIKKVKLPSIFTFSDIKINKEKADFSANINPEDGKYIIEASGEFSTLSKIPVPAKNISKGHIITQDDIEFRLVDSSKVKATSILDIVSLIGKEASTNIPAGSVVQFNSINDPILVKKNKAVNAIFKHKNLEVRTVAIALEDGKEGDIIKLKNHESGKVFQAVVDPKGHVNTNLEHSNDNIAFDKTQSNIKAKTKIN